MENTPLEENEPEEVIFPKINRISLWIAIQIDDDLDVIVLISVCLYLTNQKSRPLEGLVTIYGHELLIPSCWLFFPFNLEDEMDMMNFEF
jgi:hypothetical protein